MALRSAGNTGTARKSPIAMGNGICTRESRDSVVKYICKSG